MARFPQPEAASSAALPPERAQPAIPAGREAELGDVRRFLDSVSAAAGPSLLLIEGPAGIGKTTIWRWASASARDRGWPALEAAPARAEGELAYAALGDLLRLVDKSALTTLPEPQRRAIRVAAAEEVPDHTSVERRTVGAALLGLLRHMARGSPIVIAIDDVQWVDAPSRGALEYALRRVEDLPIGLLLARRATPGDPTPFGLARVLAPDRIHALPIGPLSVAALFQLLRDRLGRPPSRPLLVRIAEWSGGNPLFAQELARSLIAADRPLDPGMTPPMSADLEEALGHHVRDLPLTERRILLLAAIASRPTEALLRSACAALRWPLRLPSDPALVRLADGVMRPGHPLFGAQAIAVASEADRRAAHRTLATLADSPEDRARHLALAAAGPDGSVAAALEEAAEHATARGAPEVGAELIAHACRLTPPLDAGPLARRHRGLGELQALLGDSGEAAAVLGQAVAEGPPGADRALARIALASLVRQREGDQRAIEICQEAASEPGIDRVVRARIELGMRAASSDARSQLRHARAALALLPDGPPGLRARAIADVVAAESTLGGPVRYAMLDEAVALEAVERPARVLAGAAATRAWLRLMGDELAAAHGEYEELARSAEELGDDSSLARILVELAQVDLRTGSWGEAVVHAREAVRTAERADRDTDRALALVQIGAVAAARGDREVAELHLRQAEQHAKRTRDAFIFAVVAGNRGVLALGHGDDRAAVRWFDAAESRYEEANMADPALSRFHGDHLQALAACGELDAALALADAVEVRARPAGRRRVGALVDRGRGYVALASGDLDGALDAFRRSYSALDALGMRFEAARSLLGTGIVHRRRREKRLAHEALMSALGTFEELRAAAWADQARRELGRIGLRPAAPMDLTETELTVARLAAAGHRNREIAARAFMSPRTVEGVLARVYAKLGVGSRAELGAAIARREIRAPGDH